MPLAPVPLGPAEKTPTEP